MSDDWIIFNTLSSLLFLLPFFCLDVCQEGIFRRSGKMTRQQELKVLLTSGSLLKLDEGQFSVHDCASVLKNFLAQLPEPLLTEAYYPAHCQIAGWFSILCILFT